MRAVIQRVSEAQVVVADETVGRIGKGLVVLLGVAQGDADEDAAYLARKVADLRIFPNDAGKMDLSVKDIGGAVLVVSQFTLYGDCSKGRRPNFTAAAAPAVAAQLYEKFCSELRTAGVSDVQTGRFGAMMQVALCNDGPVTLIIDSPPKAAI